MKKLLKLFLYILLILVLLGALSIFLITRFINPNSYKDKISTIVHEKTGRTLVIQGDLALSFFPWLGIRAQDIQLSNAPGFQPAQLMKAGEINVQVKLMPLLSKRVEIDKVILKDLDVHLAKNKQGLENWRPQVVTSPTISKAATNREIHTKSKLALTSLAAVDLENATISWMDEQKGQAITFKQVYVKSDALTGKHFFPLEITFDVEGTKPNITGHVEFKSQLLFDKNKKTYQFKNTNLLFAPSQKETKGISLHAEQISTSLKDQTLTLINGVLSNGAFRATLNIEGQKILESPVVQGRLDAAPFNLKETLKTFGKEIVTTRSDGLQHVSFHTKFLGTTNSLKLDPLTVQLDQSNLQGRIIISNFRSRDFHFNVDIDQIAVDDYLPPHSKPASATALSVGASNTVGSNTSAMHYGDIDGSLRIGKLTVAGTQIDQLSAHITGKNSFMEINPLSGNIYQGSMEGKVSVDFHDTVPRYAIDQKFSDIDVQQLVKSGRVVGKANVTARLALVGKNKQEIMRHLNGNVSFNIKNGALMGTNIPYQVERAIALFKHQPAPPKPAAEDRTHFDILQGTGIFTRGILSNQDLFIQSPQFKGTGGGRLNLADESIDYRLRFVGLQTTTDAQGKTIQSERQTPIPVLVNGTFDKPIITPDLRALLQGEVGKKAVEKIKQQLGPEVGGLLQQIL